jgi:hypothetical protein
MTTATSTANLVREIEHKRNAAALPPDTILLFNTDMRYELSHDTEHVWKEERRGIKLQVFCGIPFAFDISVPRGKVRVLFGSEAVTEWTL